MYAKKVRAPRLFFLFLFILYCSLFISHLQAQDLIALHPFKGAAEDEEITELFFSRMEREIPLSPEQYRTFVIDLANLPADVPPGGFQPWICPSESITRGAAYALTGEAAPDQDFEGATRIRLYLWRMEGARLLGSDEMTVTEPEDLEILPNFIDWVLSWIAEDEPIIIYADGEPVVIYVDPETGEEFERPYIYQPNWLYLGLRGGGGYSRWTYDFREGAARQEVTSFSSMNFALQATVYLSNHIGLQTEINLINDFESGSSHGDFSTWYMTVPIMARLVLRGERMKSGLFGGVSMNIPLSNRGSDTSRAYFHYVPDFPGLIFGLTTAWRIGPGNIFLDGRFDYDLHWTNMELNHINYRSAFRLNIGYEMGFFPKR